MWSARSFAHPKRTTGKTGNHKQVAAGLAKARDGAYLLGSLGSFRHKKLGLAALLSFNGGLAVPAVIGAATAILRDQA